MLIVAGVLAQSSGVASAFGDEAARVAAGGVAVVLAGLFLRWLIAFQQTFLTSAQHKIEELSSEVDTERRRADGLEQELWATQTELHETRLELSTTKRRLDELIGQRDPGSRTRSDDGNGPSN